MGLRVVVEVPASDARRENIERGVFAQLAALRVADRADAIGPAISMSRSRATPWAVACGLALAACIALVVVGLRGGDPTSPIASSPSSIQTPAGGSSRFTVGDAVIDAGADTSVQVQQDPSGSVTLVLARGAIDCDVEPRRERPPFRVVAGDVVVEVVGTRFTVTRTPVAVRVDVTRGKVHVTSPTGDRLVAAGEAWSSDGVIAAARVAPPAVQPPTPAPDPAPAATTPDKSTGPAHTPHAAFLAAQRQEAHDRVAASRAYRAVANGNDSWAALAL